MNQSSFVQEAKRIQELLGEHPYKGRAQPPELVLLDELVQVHTEQLEDKAKMLLVYEGVFQAQNMMVVVLVKFAVELWHIPGLASGQYLGWGRERTRSSTETSIMLWLKYAVLFFTTLTATTSCVFMF